jgi:hypothetical protein
MNNLQDKFEAPRFALVSAGDLIYQEVYRFAVSKLAPEEVTRIKQIYASLLSTLKQLYEAIYEPEHLEEIAMLALDMIVLGTETETFETEMKESIANTHFAEKEFPWLLDGEGSEEQKNFQTTIYQETFNTLFEKYQLCSEFQTTINHHYQPRLIVCEQHYEAALDYFLNEHYLIKEADTDDHDFDIDGHCMAKNTQKFISYTAPFQTFRPYNKRKLLNIEHVFDHFPVPTNAISKKIASEEQLTVEFENEKELNGFIGLNFISAQEYCQVYSSIKFHVDLSKPMSNRELQQTVARFRNELCKAQDNNRDANMLMASTYRELEDVYSQPRLSQAPISELMEIFSAGSWENLSFKKVKLFLCGMIVHKARWLASKKEKNIIDFNHDLSERLTRDYGRGFSVQNIERGYKDVQRLLKEQIVELELLMD